MEGNRHAVPYQRTDPKLMSIILNPGVCPGGPLGGTIIKPVAWRVLNDNKRFVKDWDAFVRSWKRWKKANPLTRLDEYYFEQYLSGMRAWASTLSRYERARLFSIRRETGVKVISHYPGPRYQRGSILLSAFGVTSAAASGTLELNAANNAAVNIDLLPATNLYATFYANRDGTFDRDETGSVGGGRSPAQINSGTDWITPRPTNVGDDYEVIWNSLTGGAANMNDESYTEDVWTTINFNTRVGLSRSASSITLTFEKDIGDVGTSTSDVNQDYSVTAGDL